MPKTPIDLNARPLLDLASYARGGPNGHVQLSPDQVALIDRTVRRVPEVMVKVLPKKSNDLKAVSRHLTYIGRGGELAIETDDGQRIHDEDARDRLLEDWDLDLDGSRTGSHFPVPFERSPKLVHKIMLSMPPGTSAKGVLTAARNFAREEFALKHRYALVLHTDEPHPHVHLVVKAVSEQGVRLNIRKATLRDWRREFARHLRTHGIEANATERAVRGVNCTSKTDGIYRATQRGDSTFMRKRAEIVAAELQSGALAIESGKSTIANTREDVERGWGVVARVLSEQNQQALAAQVGNFVDRMPELKTDKEQLAAALRQSLNKSRDTLPREHQR